MTESDQPTQPSKQKVRVFVQRIDGLCKAIEAFQEMTGSGYTVELSSLRAQCDSLCTRLRGDYAIQIPSQHPRPVKKRPREEPPTQDALDFSGSDSDPDYEPSASSSQDEVSSTNENESPWASDRESGYGTDDCDVICG